MAQTKKELVQAALEQKAVDRVPVGFWFHFLADPEKQDALADPQKAAANIAGHRRFYEDFQPDFVKIMSDGYFGYPHPGLARVKTAADLGRLEPLGDRHPWIDAQVQLVQRLQQIFGAEVLSFYNIFAPARVLEWSLPAYTKELLGDFIQQDKAAVKRGLGAIAQDIAALSRRLIQEGGATGIYFSVQNIADVRIDRKAYAEVIAPGEQFILQTANKASRYNILHICGYEGHHNDLHWYEDYEAAAYNWAVAVEQLPLEKGREIFHGRTVLGGFANTAAGLLSVGDENAIKAETHRLLAAAGSRGVILGADCTVPSDIPFRHLEWVREAAAEQL